MISWSVIAFVGEITFTQIKAWGIEMMSPTSASIPPELFCGSVHDSLASALYHQKKRRAPHLWAFDGEAWRAVIVEGNGVAAPSFLLCALNGQAEPPPSQVAAAPPGGPAPPQLEAPAADQGEANARLAAFLEGFSAPKMGPVSSSDASPMPADAPTPPAEAAEPRTIQEALASSAQLQQPAAYEVAGVRVRVIEWSQWVHPAAVKGWRMRKGEGETMREVSSLAELQDADAIEALIGSTWRAVELEAEGSA